MQIDGQHLSEHSTRIANAARLIEPIGDRQRMQHGAAAAYRMKARGIEHAADIAFLDARTMQPHGGREALAA